MSYFSTIPQASDDPSISQGEILTNFGTIGTQFAINHVAFGAISNVGKHNIVEMPNQAGLPAGLAAGEGTIYTKAVSGVSQAFWTPDASTDQYQLTRSISANKATQAANPGWTWLPGGILMLYGTIAQSSTNQTVNFTALSLPNFTTIYNVQVTRSHIGTNDPGSSYRWYVNSSSVGNGGFTIINIDAHSYGYYWTAIGV